MVGAVRIEMTQPVSIGQTCEMVGAVRFEITGPHSQVRAPRTFNEILADCYAQLHSHRVRQEEEVFA